MVRKAAGQRMVSDLHNLLESKALLESFYNNTNDSIVIADLDLRILRVNPAFERTFGWMEQEVLGRKIPFFPEGYESRLKDITDQLMAGEQISNLYCVRQRKDGRLLHVSVSISPIRDASGQLVATASLIRDISELVAATEELRTTKEELESLINTTTDAISVYDLSGRFIRVNPAWTRLYGWREDEIHSLTGLDVVPADRLNEWRQLIRMVRAGHTVSGFETVRKRKDGQFIDVSMSISPSRDETGKVTGTAAIIRDIRERKATEDMMRRTEKLALTGQLAAGVAHEIRNPLTSLKGFVQLLREQGSNQRYCEIILEEVDRIEDILNEVLILAKPERVSFIQIQLSRMLNHVVTLLDTQAILKNAQIEFATDENLPRIDGIEGQLKQLFINLVKNAIESLGDGGTVKIEVVPSGLKHVRIRVEDNGCGIPAERLARLGEPFYTTKEKGTGLGMMICYRIIQNHGGTIRVDSSIGKGTTVEVVLPIKQPR